MASRKESSTTSHGAGPFLLVRTQRTRTFAADQYVMLHLTDKCIASRDLVARLIEDNQDIWQQLLHNPFVEAMKTEGANNETITAGYKWYEVVSSGWAKPPPCNGLIFVHSKTTGTASAKSPSTSSAPTALNPSPS